MSVIKRGEPHTIKTDKMMRLLAIDAEFERNEKAAMRPILATQAKIATEEDARRIKALAEANVALRQERAAIEAELKAMDEAK